MKISDWAQAHGKTPKDVAEGLAVAKNLENAPSVNTVLKDGDAELLAEFFQVAAAGPKASEADASPLMQMLSAQPTVSESRAALNAKLHNEELVRHLKSRKPVELKQFNSETKEAEVVVVPKYVPKMYRVTAYVGNMEPLDILACDESEACRVFRRCHDVKDEYRSPNLRAVEIKQTAAA